MMLLMMAYAAMATTNPMEVRLQRAYRAAPRPVRRFLERRAGCNHWGGEEAYDAERAQQIAQAIRGLRCDRLRGGRALAEAPVRQVAPRALAAFRHP